LCKIVYCKTINRKNTLPLVIVLIPILGWAVCVIVHLFFIFKNYTLVNEQEFIQRLEREKMLNEVSNKKETNEQLESPKAEDK